MTSILTSVKAANRNRYSEHPPAVAVIVFFMSRTQSFIICYKMNAHRNEVQQHPPFRLVLSLQEQVSNNCIIERERANVDPENIK